MRDHTKLRAFELADEVAVLIYRATRAFPKEEVYGLASQMRRAAVSIPSNIVEGSARRSTAEYVSFLNISSGSAAEARYLIDLAARLALVTPGDAISLEAGYRELSAGLCALISSLTEPSSPEP